MATTPGGKRARGQAKAALLTRRELAARFDVHMQTVTKWEREGLPVATRGRKGKPSLYDESAVQGWLNAREEAARGSAQSAGFIDPIEARARKEHWQAQLAEQTHKVRAGKLLPAEDVAKVWGQEVAAVRARLLAVPQTLAARVYRAAALEKEPGVERVLHEAMREVLLELAGEGAAEPKAASGKRRKRRAA